jgi:hypothetical protein
MMSGVAKPLNLRVMTDVAGRDAETMAQRDRSVLSVTDVDTL